MTMMMIEELQLSRMGQGYEANVRCEVDPKRFVRIHLSLFFNDFPTHYNRGVWIGDHGVHSNPDTGASPKGVIIAQLERFGRQMLEDLSLDARLSIHACDVVGGIGEREIDSAMWEALKVAVRSPVPNIDAAMSEHFNG